MLLANDRDPEGDVLAVTHFVWNGVTTAAGSLASIAGVGTLVINSNGTCMFTFTPAANYSGAVPIAT